MANMWQNVISMDSQSINERLLHLSLKTGYSCIQRNGQRYYGPPPNWTGPPPEKGSEVFIGRLPRDCFEDELVPILESVGILYEVRLMMNFNGYNRGFAFVTYCNPKDAWKAISALDDYAIRPGHRLGVSKSTDNCRLYFGGIPRDKTKSQAWAELVKICPTAKDIMLYPDAKEANKNRGFMFVEFESHRCASMVKRSLVPGGLKMWNENISVDWAHPEPDVDPSVMDSITKLFVRSFKPCLKLDQFENFLRKIVPSYAVQRVYIKGHYGFIHFDTRAHAQIAKDKLSLEGFDNHPLEVQWARPQYCRKVYSRATETPPRFRIANQNRPQNEENSLASEASSPRLETRLVPDVVPQFHHFPDMVTSHQLPQPVNCPQPINCPQPVNCVPQLVPAGYPLQGMVQQAPHDSNNNYKNYSYNFSEPRSPVVLYAQNSYSWSAQ